MEWLPEDFDIQQVDLDHRGDDSRNILILRRIRQWEVKTLFLSYNQRPQTIKDISHIIFTQLTCLTLPGNHIESIEELVSIFMPQIKVLRMSENNIRSVRAIRKANWPSLQYLSLEINYIVDIQNLTQCDLPMLEKLWAYERDEQNDQDRVIDHCFSAKLQTQSIECLSISDNLIQKSRNYCFHMSVQLRKLSKNDIYMPKFNDQIQIIVMFFKIVFGNQKHVMNCQQKIPFAQLHNFVRSVFKKLPPKYNLTYLDSDQDIICILSDADLDILYDSGTSKVKLQILENSEEFYDQTQEIQVEQNIFQKKESKEIQYSKNESISQISHVNESLDDKICSKLHELIPDFASEIKLKVLGKCVAEKVDGKKKTHLNDTRKSQEKIEKVIHGHVICNSCQEGPVLGMRYKCAICANFDLCSNCEKNTDHPHPFLKINHPSQKLKEVIFIFDDENEGLDAKEKSASLKETTTQKQFSKKEQFGVRREIQIKEQNQLNEKDKQRWEVVQHQIKKEIREKISQQNSHSKQQQKKEVELLDDELTIAAAHELCELLDLPHFNQADEYAKKHQGKNNEEIISLYLSEFYAW